MGIIRDCFVDDNGNVFKVKTLEKESKNIPLISYNIDRDKVLDETIRWQLNNFHDFTVHFKKVENVDLSIPIILRSDGYVMDGWHRIIKALINGVKVLPARQFKVDPKPDFKL